VSFFTDTATLFSNSFLRPPSAATAFNDSEVIFTDCGVWRFYRLAEQLRTGLFEKTSISPARAALLVFLSECKRSMLRSVMVRAIFLSATKAAGKH
jgi:hypothetical protein